MTSPMQSLKELIKAYLTEDTANFSGVHVTTRWAEDINTLAKHIPTITIRGEAFGSQDVAIGRLVASGVVGRTYIADISLHCWDYSYEKSDDADDAKLAIELADKVVERFKHVPTDSTLYASGVIDVSPLTEEETHVPTTKNVRRVIVRGTFWYQPP